MIELTPEWLACYVKTVRRAVLTEWPAYRSCIASTRVAVEVAGYFGVPVVPIAFAVDYFTQSFLDSKGTEGACVGVDGTGGLTPATGGWDGHLVPILDRRWLCDVSADQFSRPGRLLVPGPSILPLEAWPITEPLGAENEHGVLCRYKVMDNQSSWRKAPDWVGHQPMRRRAVAAAINALRQLEEVAA
jgi:hypothetical protein